MQPDLPSLIHRATGRPSRRRRAAVLVLPPILLAAACGGNGSAPPGGSATVTPTTGACSSQPATRPAGGWLGENSLDSFGGPALTKVPTAPELTTLIARVTPLMPAGYTVARTSVFVRSDCPQQPEVRVVFANAEGAAISVGAEQLVDQYRWFNVPLAGTVVRSEEAGGTEVVANDFGGTGTIRQVWVAAPDGRLVAVAAQGTNPPNVSGWPTTAFQADSQPGGPAPLSLDEVRALALAVLS